MSNVCNNVQPYKYNGKELDRKGGLDWYDYGARHYDAALGRWHAVDPMAEMYYGWSPYTYCLGNPVKYVDLIGAFTSPFRLNPLPISMHSFPLHRLKCLPSGQPLDIFDGLLQ